jgi:cytoskeletal protein CcmA (bactofilin family)
VVNAQRIEVGAGGHLSGEVMTPCLVIDEGAIFEGQSRMVERAAAAAAAAPAAAGASAGERLVRRHEAQRVSG